jgi:predicted MFS family arabinose efflux permease
MNTRKKHHLMLLSVWQSTCSFVANVIHQCIPPIVKTHFNASIAWYVMSFCHVVTTLTAPLAARVAHRIGIINTMRVYCCLFIMWALLWLLVQNPVWTLLPIVILIYSGHWFKMMEAYVTHNTQKHDWGKAFGIFQAIAWIGIFSATIVYPVIKNEIFPLVPLMTIAAMLFLFIITFFVEPDTWVVEPTSTPKDHFLHLLQESFLSPFRRWISFIFALQWFPIFYIGYAFFRWFVYTALLFIIPLLLMDVKSGSLIDWLPIGIYELMVILFGWWCGHLADKIYWKKFNILWRWLIIVGFIGMIFWHNTLWLIILGFLTWMWRNIMYSASTHVLERHNKDRKDDTDFNALERSVLKIWSVVAPLILWPVYQRWWFNYSIIVLSVIICIVGITMIAWTIRLPKFFRLHHLTSHSQ